MILLFVLALVVMVIAHVVMQRRLAKECRVVLEREEQRRKTLDELDSERNKTLYKQQKASVAAVARTDRATCKLSDEVRNLAQQTALKHSQVDAFFADSRVQKMLDEVNQ